MSWKCPENLKSIRVVVHTKVAFKVQKLIKKIIIILGFVGTQNDFGPSFETMLKMSQKHDL